MTTDAVGASFRDPSGRVIICEDRVIRVVNKAGIGDLTEFLSSQIARECIAAGKIIGTRRLDRDSISSFQFNRNIQEFLDDSYESAIFEHDLIPFRTYPNEWSPEMLYEAGMLTIELAEKCLDEGFGLKDATPLNVLYLGSNPIFVDLLSFEKRDPGDPLWLPYAQFVRTFLLPLLVNKYFGVPMSRIFSGRRDGLEPEEVYKLAGPIRRLSPSFFSLVSLPTWFGKGDRDKSDIYEQKRLKNPEQAKFVLRSMLRRTKKGLKSLEPVRSRSKWSDYMSSNNYSDAHFMAKVQFVDDALRDFAPKSVLDIGCNTGHFSTMAAKRGACVVAIDNDPVVVGELWRKARQERLDILPLVADLSAPTPATGWRNRECPSLLDRVRGRFDCVMMLALIHHLLVTERVPLREVVALAAELTTELCIVEYIGAEDSMFKRLVRGREDLYSGLTRDAFADAFSVRFEILRTQHMEDTMRWIYLLRKRASWQQA